MSYCLQSSSSPFLLIHRNYRYDLLRTCHVSSIFYSSNPLINFGISKHRKLRLYASVSETKLEASWLPSERNANDGFGGWAIIETDTNQNGDKKKKGFPSFLLVGLGASVAILLATVSYFSFSKKGFRVQFSSPLQRVSQSTSLHEVADSNVSNVEPMVKDSSLENVADIANDHVPASIEKLHRVVIPAAVDSTQQEAILLLKKLKIVEDDIKAHELCTRREYARWLVKANSVLERNPKNRISPSMLCAGSVVEAFDDMSPEDPDFWSVQALAEAGLVRSKLSIKSSIQNETVNYLPESFISRFDLLNWKAQLDYSSIRGIEEKMSRKKVNLMDVKAISDDASVALFMDLEAGDNSVLRKVFGQSRRFQPDKPATIAQAAVALTSGRMTSEIITLLSSMEAEELSRKVEMEVIRSDLLMRGDIQSFWDVKMNKVKACAIEAEKHFQTALLNLEQEKNLQDKFQGEYLKEKAALDCQRQLLLCLKEEVSEMSERLESEKTTFLAEQKDLEIAPLDLKAKQEEIIEVKSILEAEIEALRILRSWVEDEARRNQARGQVLEQVGRRWKWDE
ncbi:hypothetical protein C5167_033079 [Papaver somniferum]|uniref:SLH domain-containing protein n=1 Tax=Papaver somniferum TaxID=3469 RepID=A0A4Y7KDF5_PAPSO|nr:uncharacterized protein LOC113298053 [Papaver somniferum]RZC69955.1 hypothetical protein C5167_033079 [Papaver somniferum]